MTADGFDRLVRRYRTEIFRTVLRRSRSREDAEDLTQITFLNAYAAVQRGADPDAPRAWLHAIARNAGARRFHESRRTEVELDADSPLAADEEGFSIHELQVALARLTFNQRASLLMREVGGLSASEIGARLDISSGAVATLLFRARKALRAELDGETDSRFGRLGLLWAGLIRQAWLRAAPLFDGGQVLSRSAAAVGVAAATTGVAALTGSVPSAARAVQAHAAVNPAPVAAVLHTATPVVRVPTDVGTRPVRAARRAPVGPPAVHVVQRVLHAAPQAAVAAPAVEPPPVSRLAVAVEPSRPAAPESASIAPEPSSAQVAPAPQQPAAAKRPPAATPEPAVVTTVSEGLPPLDAVTAAAPALPAPDVSQATPVDVGAVTSAAPGAVTSAAPATSEILPPPLPPPPLPPAVATLLPGS